MDATVKMDLIGAKFGKLTVIDRSKVSSQSGNARWNCICECGTTVTVIGSHLRSGHTKSCGCNRFSNVAKGYSKERLYGIWKKMHIRCYDKTSDRYKWYGEKGITICSDWHDFIPFREWALKNDYDKKLTIDRIDSTGNYSPENCRWVSMTVQANNRSGNRIVFYQGEKFTAAELAEAYNLKQHTVYNRLKLGWNVEKIVETPEAGDTHDGK